MPLLAGSLADAVAVVHAAVVVLVVVGGLCALRWRRLLLPHAVVALAVVAVNLAGAPCPLTDLELALREAAGQVPYRGGFLGHYAFAPLGLDVRSTAAQAAQHLAVVVPNAVAYGALLVRALPRRVAA